MKIALPEKVTYIIDKLLRAGYEAYAVGGCVRDSLMGRVPEDWDITTSARPEQVKAQFARTIDTGIQHGTVTVMIDHEGFEVTTYRIDGEYEDGRHPKEVAFTFSLVEDLKRRDFTINAMAYNGTEGIVDVFGGTADMEARTIRCVGEPEERFGEDALRILRAVRFSAQLGFRIEDKTRGAARKLAPTLEKISAERIQTEIVKLLVSQQPDKWREVYETGISRIILPEYDAFPEADRTHILKALGAAEKDKTLRLAILLHKSGETEAEQILRRLRFDNHTIKTVSRSAKWFVQEPDPELASVRKYLADVGEELFLFLMKMKKAWFSVEEQSAVKMEYLGCIWEIYEEIKKSGDCFAMKMMAVGGKDLIEAGVPPGKGMGDILNRLFLEVLEHPEFNNRELLIKMAREYI